MLCPSRIWLALVAGILLPVACFAQNWSGGPDYALDGASVRGVAQGQVSAARASDVLVSTDTGLWMLTGDGKGGLQTPVRLMDGAVGPNYTFSYVAGTVTVGTATVRITTTSTVNPSTYGETVIWTFTVAPTSGVGVTPTGSLALTANGAFVGTVPLANGVATFTSGTLPAGMDTIVAAYSGDSNYH